MSRTSSARVDGKTVVVQKKKRLPTSTTVFERRDAPPKGVFTKYSWNIANLMQVKQILDTPSVRLDISRAFVDRDSDENYELIDETADENSGRNNHQTKVSFIQRRDLELERGIVASLFWGPIQWRQNLLEF